MLPDHPRLKHCHLVYFAGHRCARHAIPSKIANRLPQSAQAYPLKLIAQFGQFWVTMILESQAVHAVPLAAQGLGHDKRIPAPTSDQANFFARWLTRTNPRNYWSLDDGRHGTAVSDCENEM